MLFISTCTYILYYIFRYTVIIIDIYISIYMQSCIDINAFSCTLVYYMNKSPHFGKCLATFCACSLYFHHHSIPPSPPKPCLLRRYRHTYRCRRRSRARAGCRSRCSKSPSWLISTQSNLQRYELFSQDTVRRYWLPKYVCDTTCLSMICVPCHFHVWDQRQVWQRPEGHVPLQ